MKTNNDNIYLEPNEWVAESLLLTITGITKSALDDYRNLAWVEGVHFNRASPRGSRGKNSLHMYNRVEINKYFANPLMVA